MDLSDAHRCDVVVTFGRCGMVCAERTGPTWHLPATPPEVRDVCGAGDTVFAALAVALITGKSLRAACRAAMRAAGRQVGAVGVTAIACIAEENDDAVLTFFPRVAERISPNFLAWT